MEGLRRGLQPFVGKVHAFIFDHPVLSEAVNYAIHCKNVVSIQGGEGDGGWQPRPDLLNNDRAGKTPCRPTTLHVEARLFGPICWAAYEFQDSSVMLSS